MPREIGQMKSMMSRSPFSRSSRQNSDSAVSSHSHSQSVSDSPPPRPPESFQRPGPLRHSSSMSMELRGMRRLEQRRSMEHQHYLSCKARAQNYNPPVDLRMLDYVSTFDNNLMCPICRCPFVDPVVLAECDHCFCRDCIRQTWNSSASYSPLGPKGDCPSCRTPARLGPKSAVSKILVNLTDELLVKCPKAEEGCKAEIKRGEVQDHATIYCGYALVECIVDNCELPVRKKDATQGCLHYGVSCLSCHKELQMWRLETHWRSECPDRKVNCELCTSAVFYRDLEDHQKETCPAISMPCPGKAWGCTSRSRRGQAEIHAKSCMFAKLAPMLSKQQDRLDEQEAAQKMMSRKLEVLESGFSNMQSILHPSPSPPAAERRSSRSARNENRTPLSSNQTRFISNTTLDSEATASPVNFDFDFPAPTIADIRLSPPSRPPPNPPGPRPADLPEPFSPDFDFDMPPTFPPPSTDGGPYASPLHHLLSMHESLRDEMGRVSAALSELDGRHSTQTLNENLRTREEISYIGAQVAGLQRQVQWLTSTQLQRLQGRTGTAAASTSASTAKMADASTGVDVEAAVSAVSTAATALRGAARVVNVGGRESRPRGPSEEGRTKL